MSRRRRKTYFETIRELRDFKARMTVFDTTFQPVCSGINAETREILARHYEYRFSLWWDSWIEPRLKNLETRLAARKDEKRANDSDEGGGL